jgi:acyl transferase domain-containing protein
MLALNADEATALAACAAEEGKLWIAVRNGVGRQVLAGEVAAVDRAAAALGAKGFTCRALPVNRAYHTPLMAEAQRVLGEKLAGMKLRPPSVPLCCNGTGTWMTEATATDASYWAAHVASCVRWADNMDALATRAPAAVVEVGSGSSLAPLLAECRAPGAADLSTISTLRHPKVAWEKGGADQQCFGEALASLWERGCALDWRAYHAGERYIKLQLPTYAFAEEVYWVDDDASMYVASSASELEAALAEISRFVVPSL